MNLQTGWDAAEILKQRLTEAKADLELAKADLELSKKNLAQWQEMYERLAKSSREERDLLNGRLEIAKHGLGHYAEGIGSSVALLTLANISGE